MNNIKCPQCGLINWMTATACVRCRMPFANLPSHAYISLPASEQARAQGHSPMPYYPQPMFIPDTNLQRKVWMWYVIFCVLMAALYLILALASLGALIVEPDAMDKDAMEVKIQAAIYFIMGLLFFIPYALAPFLPKKSWTWVYGLVMLIFGSACSGGCCFWPITIPLIVQWVKPDIKHMFGHR